MSQKGNNKLIANSFGPEGMENSYQGIESVIKVDHKLESGVFALATKNRLSVTFNTL